MCEEIQKRDIKCPYCDFVQDHNIEKGWNTLVCWPEHGGCDKYFTINIWFVPVIRFYTMKEENTLGTEGY